MGKTGRIMPLGNRYKLTPEAEALRLRIRELWMDAGLSAGQIGRILSETRNVVIGHIFRMNLPPREGKTSRIDPHPARAPQAGLTRPAKPVPLPVLTEAQIAPQHIGMDDLSRHTCRWPYGDRFPFTFCGHPTHANGKYCAGHHAIAFVKSHGPKAGMQGQSRQKQQFGLR